MYAFQGRTSYGALANTPLARCHCHDKLCGGDGHLARSIAGMPQEQHDATYMIAAVAVCFEKGRQHAAELVKKSKHSPKSHRQQYKYSVARTKRSKTVAVVHLLLYVAIAACRGAQASHPGPSWIRDQ